MLLKLCLKPPCGLQEWVRSLDEIQHLLDIDSGNRIPKLIAFSPHRPNVYFPSAQLQQSLGFGGYPPTTGAFHCTSSSSILEPGFRLSMAKPISC